jgi:hypothetical protein
MAKRKKLVVPLLEIEHRIRRLTVVWWFEVPPFITSVYRQKGAFLTEYVQYIIPWSRALLEKLIVTQLVKKFPALYGTQRSVCSLVPTWASCIQSTPSHLISLWGVVNLVPKPQYIGAPLITCPQLLIQYIYSYPPYLEALIDAVHIGHSHFPVLPGVSSNIIHLSSTQKALHCHNRVCKMWHVWWQHCSMSE